MQVAHVPINRWMKKEKVVWIPNGILRSCKESYTGAICRKMECKTIMGSETDQAQRVKWIFSYGNSNTNNLRSRIKEMVEIEEADCGGGE